MKPRTYRYALFAIFCAALALRAGYVVGAKWHEPLQGDQIYYSAAADALAEGKGFIDPLNVHPVRPGADHPPLTALVATPGSLLGGDAHGIQVQRLSMAFVGALIVFPLAAIGRRLGTQRTGLIAAAIAAGYPGFWINDGLIMSEGIGALTIALTIAALYRWRASPRPGNMLLVGAAAGSAILARPESALLLPLCIAPFLVVILWRQWRQLVRTTLVLAAGVFLLLGPWVGPNLVRFHRPVTLSTNDGLTILGTNCPLAYQGDAKGLWFIQCLNRVDSDGDGINDLDDPARFTTIDQSDAAATYRQEGLTYLRAHRGELPGVMVIRVMRVWGFWPGQMVTYNTGEGREPWASWCAYFSGLFLIFPALAGLFLLRKKFTDYWPLVSQFLIVTIIAALFYGLWRFRVGSEVALVALSAVSITALCDRYQKSANARP